MCVTREEKAMKVYWVWVDLVEDSEGKQACCGVEKFLLFFFSSSFFLFKSKNLQASMNYARSCNSLS